MLFVQRQRNGIPGNEDLLVGGDDPNVHLGIVGGDAGFAAGVVLLRIHLHAHILHIGADSGPDVRIVLLSLIHI